MDSVSESVLREMAICARKRCDADGKPVVLHNEYVGRGDRDVLVSAAARRVCGDEEKGEKGEVVDAA